MHQAGVPGSEGGVSSITGSGWGPGQGGRREGSRVRVPQRRSPCRAVKDGQLCLAAGCEEALPRGAGRGGQCGWGRRRDEGRLPPPSLPPRGGLAGVVTLTCHSFFSSAGLWGAATGQRACPRGREVGGSEPAHAAWVLGGLSCGTVSSDHRGVPGGGRGPGLAGPRLPHGLPACLPSVRWFPHPFILPTFEAFVPASRGVQRGARGPAR